MPRRCRRDRFCQPGLLPEARERLEARPGHRPPIGEPEREANPSRGSDCGSAVIGGRAVGEQRARAPGGRLLGGIDSRVLPGGYEMGPVRQERATVGVGDQHRGAQVRGYVGQVQEEPDDVVVSWHDKTVIRIVDVQYLGVVDRAPILGLIARAEQAQVVAAHQGRNYATAAAPAARTIRAAKDTGLRNLPLHGYDQNKIWCELVALACELLAWTQTLVLTGPARRWEPKRLRLRSFACAGRLARGGRRLRLRLAAQWPWAADITTGFARIQALAPG